LSQYLRIAISASERGYNLTERLGYGGRGTSGGMESDKQINQSCYSPLMRKRAAYTILTPSEDLFLFYLFIYLFLRTS